jgi:hypothetical protein
VTKHASSYIRPSFASLPAHHHILITSPIITNKQKSKLRLASTYSKQSAMGHDKSEQRPTAAEIAYFAHANYKAYGLLRSL